MKKKKSIQGPQIAPEPDFEHPVSDRKWERLRLTSWPGKWPRSRSALRTRRLFPAPRRQSKVSRSRRFWPRGSGPNPDPERRWKSGTGSAADRRKAIQNQRIRMNQAT